MVEIEERPTRQFFIDLACFLVLQIPYIYMFLYPEPYKTGFFCDDQSLMYPVKEEKVSMATMIIVSIAAVYVVILVTDIALYFTRSSRTEFLRDYQLCCCRINTCIWVCFKDIAAFMVGASLLQNSSQATKILVGKLRPNFFNVCKPNFTELNCNEFVTNYTCTSGAGEDELYNAIHSPLCCTKCQWSLAIFVKYALNDENETGGKTVYSKWTSFPSSHASFTSFCMLYIAFFFEAKLTWKGSSFLRVTLQSGALAFSLYATVTRLSDHVHFLSDVVSGLVFGTVLSAWTAFYVSDMFQPTLNEQMSGFKTLPPSSASFQKDYNNYGSTHTANSETSFARTTGRGMRL